MVIAMPVPGADGATGVMAVTMSTAAQPLWLPPGVDKQMVLIELDPTRKIVIAASKGAPLTPGAAPDSWLLKPLRGTSTITDLDGTERIYTEVTAENGWHVLAGIPKSVALSSAQEALRRNLMIGGAAVLRPRPADAVASHASSPTCTTAPLSECSSTPTSASRSTTARSKFTTSRP